jgi:hypothetical protein
MINSILCNWNFSKIIIKVLQKNCKYEAEALFSFPTNVFLSTYYVQDTRAQW